MAAGSPPPPLERYINLRNRGDKEGALAAAREACMEAPEQAAAHYAMGEALAALGDHRGAGGAFVEAVRRAPQWADAWVNLGLARYRQGAPEAAKAAMREALRAEPSHAAARSNLGALMRITGEIFDGEALLRQTLEADPTSVGARLNLVADLQLRDRSAEALALLDSAPAQPTDPDALRHWHLAYALAYLQMGRREEARAAMSAVEAMGPIPPAIAPLWRRRELLLAELSRDPEGALLAARKLEEAVEDMGPDALPEHRIIAHYDLARFWSSRGDGSAAFGHWDKGHKLLRRSQPFSRELFDAFIEANVTAFDAAAFRSENVASNRDSAPVFIVGMPRSGTSLTEQILAAHNAVHGAGERNALARMFVRIGGGDGAEAVRRVASLDPAQIEAAAKQYLADLHALAPNKARIIDKMPGNELFLGLVGRMLPGARIINCVRDPRDIGLSIWSYRFFGEHPYSHDLADLGWTMGRRARLVQHWRELLPNRILNVALEDWVNDFGGTLARVLEHLDLPPDDACARFYEVDRDVRTASFQQVRRPINKQGVGRWRPYEKELQPLIRELAAAGMLEAAEAKP